MSSPPQVGRAKKLLCDSHRIGEKLIQRPHVFLRHKPKRRFKHLRPFINHFNCSPKRQTQQIAGFKTFSFINVGRQSRDAVGRVLGCRQRGLPNIADIAVLLGLHERPALQPFINGDRCAQKELPVSLAAGRRV